MVLITELTEDGITHTRLCSGVQAASRFRADVDGYPVVARLRVSERLPMTPGEGDSLPVSPVADTTGPLHPGCCVLLILRPCFREAIFRRNAS